MRSGPLLNCVILAALLSLTGPSRAAEAETPAPVAADRLLSVRLYGAAGDGKTDDTKAFRRALTAAIRQPSGRTVLVPPGTYLITQTLTLESTLLLGQAAGGWSADSRPLPTLRVAVPNPEPCIRARIGASIHGLCFDFDVDAAGERESGPCIMLGGSGISVSNVLIHNPVWGIIADGRANVGHLNLENILIVNARKCGVSVEHALEVTTLRNVEVTNRDRDLARSSVGFRLGHNDEVRLSDCSVVQAAVGFHFVESTLPDGRLAGAWAGMANCTVDFSDTAVRVDAANIVRIGGGSLWAHQAGIVLSGPSDLVISGADIRADRDHAVHVKDCESLTLTGCLLKRNSREPSAKARVRIDGGNSVLISGCTFDDTSTGIRIGAEVKRVAITGNVFAGMATPAIVDESGQDTRKLISNNLGAD